MAGGAVAITSMVVGRHPVAVAFRLKPQRGLSFNPVEVPRRKRNLTRRHGFENGDITTPLRPYGAAIGCLGQS